MFKKLVFCAAALSLSAAALANGNSVSMVSAPAVSDFNSGIYLGIQGGYGVSGWKHINSTISTSTFLKSSNEDGIAGRVFVGYDFTKNFAAEFGYMYFGQKAKLTERSDNTVDAEVRTQAFDLVGKGKIEFLDNFDVYGKLGIGYLMSSGLHSGLKSDGTAWFDKDKAENLSAVVGTGVSYYFTRNLWIDASWTTHIVNKGFGITDKGYYGDYQPNADLYALGIAYKF